MTWTIQKTQSEREWTKAYVKSVLDSPCMPARDQRIGTVSVKWEELDPGVALVYGKGGTPEDRYLAEQIVLSRLTANGYERAIFSFDREHKTSDWNDIMAKAKRLIDSGNVTILRNGYNNVVAYVIGDHGEYQCEIGRDDPNSRAITTWQCDCPWDQYAWQRTRKWKKYEGRPCAHVLAAFWQAQSTPLDPDAFGENIPPGQAGPLVPGGEQMGLPFQEQGPVTPPGPGPGVPGPGGQLPLTPQPQAPGILPPFPGEQLQLVPPGQLQPGQPGITVSLPGARQPTPFNPIQNPSTYSKVAEVIELNEGVPTDWGNIKDAHRRRPFIQSRSDGTIWLGPPGAHHKSLWEATGLRRGDGSMGQAEAMEGYVMDDGEIGYFWQRSDPLHEIGKQKLRQHLNLPVEGDWQFESATFENSDMVRIEDDEYGIAEGKSEEHGAGQYKLIPKGSIGEVLGEDPTTGWVDVIFVGPQANAGPLEPYHIRAWVEPSNLTPMPNIKKPGPAIRRR